MHQPPSDPPITDPADETASLNMFRRGKRWLRSQGVGLVGKKAKRILHRRHRHEIRAALRHLSL